MSDLTYSPLQERAIDAIVEWYNNPFQQEFLIHGYAGTGKSTCVSEAIKRIKDKYKISNVVMGAYTGKAAHVLRKKGNMNAQTIHSMIYTVSEDPETGELHSVLNQFGSIASAELVVLDEVSMIGQDIANDLRSFDCKILCMGDPGQLPPINGEGAFNHEPDFFLDEIHRQALDSPIIELSVMARKGIALPLGYKKGSVQVLPLTNANAELMHRPETQVLCGLNRVRWGITQELRGRLGFTGELPIKGEKILCCKNNRERGLFNGASGILKKLEVLDNGAWRITADVEGNFQKNLLTDPYLFKQHFDNGKSQADWKKKRPNYFDFGYCWSVHKAQGSSWPDVTVIDNSASFRDDEFKHRYTSITRAETALTVLV